ncbi:MAG: N-acetylmuramoyl-L-alanine amidase [Rickettsiales bacterium]|jgi:N-acetylmuramoyl-L-alanine amidase|nr:N-acetylmuramoyl-L-alanine amidase [Rickettsiales bacterium]
MKNIKKSIFSGCASRRTVLKIAGGGILAITFLPRVAFAARNEIKSIRSGSQPGNKTRLVIESSARPGYSLSYPSAGAPRLVVELSNTVAASLKPALASGTLIKSISQNQSGSSLQVIATLTKPIGQIPKNNIMVLEPNGDTGYRLVLDFAAGNASADAGAVAAAKAEPKKNTRKPIIVVDAGHGGKDPGCIGKSGVKEKDVVLSVAKKLRTRLVESGFTVHLTRNKDAFLNLGTRADIAEQKHADLFMSLHANANPSRDMKGFSVYTLSKKASDEEAQKLADAENAADKIEVDGFARFEPDVRNALSALQQHAIAEMSVEFAAGVRKKFNAAGITKQTNGALRSAPFAVLRSTIPSALLELGHLSNKDEEKLLKSDSYQQKLVIAITDAVKGYNFDT